MEATVERRRQKMHLVAVYIPPTMLKQIDTIAAEQETTRSEAIRQLLRLGLEAWAGRRA